MRKVYLRSKNLVLKVILTFLGFTLAASQCLAQYMAILPTVTLKGKLKGVTDTLSKFMIIIEKRDTIYTSAKENYEFEYFAESRPTFTIEVQEDSKKSNRKYLPATEIVAIEPKGMVREEYVTIKLKKKN